MNLEWLMPEPDQPDPGSILLSLMKSRGQERAPGGGAGAPARGPGGGIMEQLRQGFLDAGRPDLARMVGTGAFDTWIGQESGWDPQAVSPTNNQGQANGGLFQFWYGHDFSNKAEGRRRFKASPYQQAQWAATQFDLTPQDIRGYARDIREGDYGGWG